MKVKGRKTGSAAYLYRKRGIFYYRYASPKSSTWRYHMRELRVSLKTGYVGKAQRASWTAPSSATCSSGPWRAAHPPAVPRARARPCPDSSIFLTMLTDGAGFFIFLGLAWVGSYGITGKKAKQHIGESGKAPHRPPGPLRA